MSAVLPLMAGLFRNITVMMHEYYILCVHPGGACRGELVYPDGSGAALAHRQEALNWHHRFGF